MLTPGGESEQVVEDENRPRREHGLQRQEHPAVAVDDDHERLLATVLVGPGASKIDVPCPVGCARLLATIADAIAFAYGMVGAHGHPVAPKQPVDRRVTDLGEAALFEFSGDALPTPSQTRP